MDQDIDKKLQMRELSKVRKNFIDSLEEYYTSRRSKEFVTLKCGELCFRTSRERFKDDDLSRYEKACLLNCYQKTYNYLAFANTTFTYLTTSTDKLNDILGTTEEENM